MKYILALDQGTTSSRAIVFDRQGSVVAVAQREFQQIFPQPGWVEHDADEIWTVQKAVMQDAVRKVGGAERIAAIGITNQRETMIVWDAKTGMTLHPAIVWQCRRSTAICERLNGRP